MRAHVVRVVSVVAFIFTLAVPTLAFGKTAERNAALACGRLLESRPQIPDGAEVIKDTESYVIYKKSGDTRILFDSRVAELPKGFVTTSLLNTSDTWAWINPYSGRPIVFEGRHRLVSAANGFLIRPNLGGTGHMYWLDYHFRESPGSVDGPEPLAGDHKITWDVSHLVSPNVDTDNSVPAQ